MSVEDKRPQRYREGVVEIGFVVNIADGIKVTEMTKQPYCDPYVGMIAKKEHQKIICGLIQERKLETGNHKYMVRITIDMEGSSMKLSVWPSSEDEPDWSTIEQS